MTPAMKQAVDAGYLSASAAELLDRIEEVGRGVRAAVRAAVEEVAGPHPRPSRLVTELGLDKSLASRLVAALKVDSDREFLHRLPSPAGLRILWERSTEHVSPAVREALFEAIKDLQEFHDDVPGGRDMIDARIADVLSPARERQEKLARQGVFRSMSYLLGHYCETLYTSLFLYPSPDGAMVDAIEIQHREDLRRMRPSAPLALLRINSRGDGAPAPDSTWIEPLGGLDEHVSPLDYLLPEFTRPGLPRLTEQVQGPMTAVTLAGDDDSTGAQHIVTAIRIRRALDLVPQGTQMPIRSYLLHSPCRRLVRHVFVHEAIYRGASMHVLFRIPAPTVPFSLEQTLQADAVDRIDLLAPVEQLSPTALASLWGQASGHPGVLQHVTRRVGFAAAEFRGWRCTMDHPLPLAEMVLWAALPEPATP